ncbi:MAG: hypothetical protein RL404_59 [Pseudomonadota bacterium]
MRNVGNVPTDNGSCRSGLSNEAVTKVIALPILGSLACVPATLEHPLLLAQRQMIVLRGIAVPKAFDCAWPSLRTSLARAYVPDAQRLA